MNPLTSLAELGDLSDTVARTLLDKGIRGTPHTNTTCPIANYLTSCGFHGVRVGMTFTKLQAEDVGDPATFTSEDAVREVGAAQYCQEEHLLRYLLPPPVREFIERFDAGAFPELSDV